MSALCHGTTAGRNPGGQLYRATRTKLTADFRAVSVAIGQCRNGTSGRRYAPSLPLIDRSWRRRSCSLTTWATWGRRRRRSRSSKPPGTEVGADCCTGRRAASFNAPTINAINLVASSSDTGVDDTQTSLCQWLNTTVELSLCHVTRRYRSAPRTSGRKSRRVNPSSTDTSIDRQWDKRQRPEKDAEPNIASRLTRQPNQMRSHSGVGPIGSTRSRLPRVGVIVVRLPPMAMGPDQPRRKKGE